MIVVNHENLESYVNFEKEITKDGGENSKCYISIDGNVFKKLNVKIPLNSKDFAIYSLLSKHTSELLILPKQLFIEGDYLLGYFMDYVNSPSLFDLPQTTKIIDMLTDINRVQNEVRKISELYVRFRDIHSRDIYFGKTFNIGDIDAFIISKNETFEDLYNSNIKKVYHGIIAGIFRGYFPEYHNLITKDPDLNMYYESYIEGETSPVDFNIYVSEICNKIGIDVYSCSIENLRSALKEIQMSTAIKAK